jgi:hypothetical protein
MRAYEYSLRQLAEELGMSMDTATKYISKREICSVESKTGRIS